ncbi:esterase FE4-like [Zerene cesonia]|uniref:esterase FE4-like n=1 Tax=Zerene cesonia TaxID=33412 RepID=UPI0018E5563E|nr:esterase FE4-like [Zerene cesonia]
MKYRKKLVLFSLFLMNLVDQPAPEVDIEQGKLVGKVSGDGSFFEYIGIPYATTNSSTRFKAPGPPPRWAGVFQAITADMCPQISLLGRVVGSEDCLKINVYVPALARRPLKVMVFIHGGAFILGSGGKLIYAPHFFMKKDVILVTFNYRLGALGFICLGTKDAPGNAGLKDQIAALKWVKKNIAAFGGDPHDITLFGESAGATSASVLLASPITEGLFTKIIMQSGNSVSNWAINRKPVWKASLVAKKMGFDSEDPHELYEFFKTADYRDLVSVPPGTPDDLFFDTQLLHLPCVEEEIPGEEAVITDLPYNLLSQNVKNIPVIHGTNSKEGMFLTSEDDGSVDKRNGMYIIASDLRFSSVEEGMTVSRRAQEFYFGDEPISLQKIDNVTDLYTDLYFEVPAIMETELLLNRTTSRVFNYIFNYSGGRNFLKQRSGRGHEPGACHADDLFYLFDSALTPFPISSQDWLMIDTMTTMWANFAKYSDPTPNSQKLPYKWLPSEKNNLRFLYIDDKLKMGPMPHLEAYAMWKDIYTKYRKTNVKQPSIGPVT